MPNLDHAKSTLLKAKVGLSAGADQDLVAAPGAGLKVYWWGFDGTFSVSIDVKNGTTSITDVVTSSSSNPQLSPFPFRPGGPPYGVCDANTALKVSVGTSGVMRGIVWYSIEKVIDTGLA